MIKKLSFLLFTFALLNFCFPSEKAILRLEIKNIEKAKGYIWVGIYDSEKSFLDKEQATAVEGKPIERVGDLQIDIKDLPYGTYAVAIFHDINGNGELDQGMFGVPKEPYAFSQPLKSKWRAPTFEDVRFVFNSNQSSLSMTLKEWTW